MYIYIYICVCVCVYTYISQVIKLSPLSRLRYLRALG